MVVGGKGVDLVLDRFKLGHASTLGRLRASAHWPGASAAVLAAVAGLSKIWMDWFNKVNVVNMAALYKCIENRQPLITVANHHSCMDDPLMWGALKWNVIVGRPHLMRWTLAAEEICFTNFLTRKFFVLGRCVSVIRGHGVYQEGVDKCLDVLNNNGWVHVFPEGKVNLSKERIRLKWGVGRLVSEANEIPTVLPVWHLGVVLKVHHKIDFCSKFPVSLGIDDVLPNKRPYIPQIGKKVTILVGEPISLKGLVESLLRKRASSREIRIAITDVVQEALDNVKCQAESAHKDFLLSPSQKSISRSDVITPVMDVSPQLSQCNKILSTQ